MGASRRRGERYRPGCGASCGRCCSRSPTGRPRFEADRREREELAERFFDAFREGDVDRLRELLAADVQVVGDSGGKAPLFASHIIGPEKVVQVLAALIPLFVRIGVVVEPHEVNGQPGAIFRDRDAKVLSTLALDILDGRIQTIRSVINPDKLGHAGSGGGRLGAQARGEPGSPAGVDADLPQVDGETDGLTLVL